MSYDGIGFAFFDFNKKKFLEEKINLSIQIIAIFAYDFRPLFNTNH